MNTSKLDGGRPAPHAGVAKQPGRLLNDRLIRAGENCPFSEACPHVKDCNRPKHMDNAFSCGTARGFDLLYKGGSFSQLVTVNGDLHPSVHHEKPDLLSFFEGEVISEEARKPGRPGRNKKRP